MAWGEELLDFGLKAPSFTIFCQATALFRGPEKPKNNIKRYKNIKSGIILGQVFNVREAFEFSQIKFITYHLKVFIVQLHQSLQLVKVVFNELEDHSI